jgi:hypothetical protein
LPQHDTGDSLSHKTPHAQATLQDNYRCLQSFELKPEQVSALVGPNGGGKSSVFDVLSAVQAFLGAAGVAAHQAFSASTLTRWDSRPVQTIELEVSEGHEGPRYVYRLEVHHDIDKRTAAAEETLSCDGQILYRSAKGQVELFADDPSPQPVATFPVDARRSFLPILEARPNNQRIMGFKRWIAGMWLFRLLPRDIVPHTREESAFVAPDGSNFVPGIAR